MNVLRTGLLVLIAAAVVLVAWRRYKRGKLMSVIWAIAGMAAAVYIGLGVMLFLTQSRVLYQPYRAYVYTPDDIGLAYESVTLTAADGQTAVGWYLPAEPGRWTVLFCHGNAGNISHRINTLQMLNDLGLNCLIVDYRGYGQSPGRPSEEGTLLDIRAGWDWLVHEKGIPADQIILFGRSLGGSIAAIVAAQVDPAAAILESTFTSFVDVGRHYYPYLPVRLFARFEYDTRRAVRALQCPVLIIHSPDDEIIPYTFGQQLYEAAPEPKRFRRLSGGHNEGFYENAELYRDIWREWLDHLAAVKSGG